MVIGVGVARRRKAAHANDSPGPHFRLAEVPPPPIRSLCGSL
jgi:hypothetical protein